MDDGSHVTRTYTFDELVGALNKVQAYDWASFLRSRLDYTGDILPEHGVERGGWKLAYTAQPSDYTRAVAHAHHSIDLAYSLGATFTSDGKVRDVQWDGPAYAAGLVPGMKVIAVDGSAFSAEALTQAVSRAKGGTIPIGLTVSYIDTVSTLRVDYHGGLRYPHLLRVEGTPDYIGEIATARK